MTGDADRAGAFLRFLGGLGAPALPHSVISFAYNTTVPLEVIFPQAIENTNGLFIYFFMIGKKNSRQYIERLKKIKFFQ